MTVPPVRFRVEEGTVGWFCSMIKEGRNEDAKRKSESLKVRVPSSKSRSKYSKAGGSVSGITSEAWRAFPSVIAKTSTLFTSSIAYACIVRYVFSLWVARVGISRILSKSCCDNCTTKL